MSIFDQLAGSDGPDAPTCSRKGCRAPAAWSVLWNNPRIHTPERRKQWLACPEHRDWLQDYLTQRGLWKETLPFQAAAEASPGARRADAAPRSDSSQSSAGQSNTGQSNTGQSNPGQSNTSKES